LGSEYCGLWAAAAIRRGGCSVVAMAATSFC
jgi:hypothetical protein